MAWLKSYRELEHHPKLQYLQRLLGQSKDSVIGQLHRLWWWCLDYAENGQLEKYGKDKIGKILEIEIDKFIEAGFIDIEPNLRIHDWYEYVAAFLQAKYKQKPNKWQLVRDCYNGCKNGSMTSSKERQDKIREDKIRIKDVSKSELIKSKEKTTTVAFDEFYSLYPKHKAREDARKAWNTFNPDLELWTGKIRPALLAQKLSEDWKQEQGKFIPLPGSWIRGRRWEDEIKKTPSIEIPEWEREIKIGRQSV